MKHLIIECKLTQRRPSLSHCRLEFIGFTLTMLARKDSHLPATEDKEVAIIAMLAEGA